MPPEGTKPLERTDREALIHWVKGRINNSDPHDRDPGPALTRRLSRPEYNRTLRDLLGIDFDVGDAVGIPDDSQGFGFANQVGVLNLSPTLMEKYFAAAEHVLERILGPVPDVPIPVAKNVNPPTPAQPMKPAQPAVRGPISVHYRCADSNVSSNQIRPHFQIANGGAAPVPLRELTLRYWFKTEGATETQHWCDYARVDAKNVTLTAKKLITPVKVANAYLEVGFAGGTLEPKTDTGDIQIRVAKKDWAPFDQASHYSFDPSQTKFAESLRVTLYRDGKLIWGKEPDESSTPLQEPKAVLPKDGSEKAPGKQQQGLPAVREAIFIVRPGDGMNEKQAARRIIEEFSRKAWRRPILPAEIETLLAIFDRAKTKGHDFTFSVRPMLKAVLVSPHFLFRVEKVPPSAGKEHYRRINDWELAVRLSYFIWSSMPDAELSALAAQGKLGNPAELEKQARRMLASPKAKAMTENFGGPWMQLGNLATARPTMEFFPSFTPSLKESMFQETSSFFDNLRVEDRSVLDLIDADYTFINEELAKHYGINGVNGPQMRKVKLHPEHHRGGLLGMGSVLASTSHTFRTSPTMRGKYVLEVILGTPPPPPPANAGVLKDEARGQPPKTFRESLARHASVPACAACHSKIDPLGFGLENFDGVGRWRDGNATQLDTSGILPSLQKFSGPVELKKILMQQQDQVRRNLSEQMLSYALGRPLDDCDESSVLEIQTALQDQGNRFSAVILGVVKSFPFQHRRREK